MPKLKRKSIDQRRRNNTDLQKKSRTENCNSELPKQCEDTVVLPQHSVANISYINTLSSDNSSSNSLHKTAVNHSTHQQTSSLHNIDSCCQSPVQLTNISSSNADTAILPQITPHQYAYDGIELTDIFDSEIPVQLMDLVSSRLRQQFSVSIGLLSLSYIHQKMCSKECADDHCVVPIKADTVQFHYLNGHYVVSSQKSCHITVYDSLFYEHRVEQLIPQLELVYELVQRHGANRATISYCVPQAQGFSSDCGAFSVANAFMVLSHKNPCSVNIHQPFLRDHIFHCLRRKRFTDFPSFSNFGEQRDSSSIFPDQILHNHVRNDTSNSSDTIQEKHMEMLKEQINKQIYLSKTKQDRTSSIVPNLSQVNKLHRDNGSPENTREQKLFMDKMRKQKTRSHLTLEEKQRMWQKDRKSYQIKRLNRSDNQKLNDLAKQRHKKRSSRDNQIYEKQESDLKSDKVSRRKSRENRTTEKKESDLKSDRVARGKRRENRTSEEKESDLKSDKMSRQKCRENRSAEKEKSDLKSDKVARGKRRENRTSGEKESDLKSDKMSRQKSRENRTSEKKESDLKSDKMSRQKCRENRSAEKKKSDLKSDKVARGKRRENRTSGEKENDLKSDKVSRQKSRENRTSEKKESDLKSDKMSRQKGRENRSTEKKKSDLKCDKVARGKRRENRTSEEKESDLKSDKMSRQKCRENRSAEKKKSDLKSDKVARGKRRENRTSGEKESGLKSDKMSRQKCRENRTSEKKESDLKSDKMSRQKCRENRSAEKKKSDLKSDRVTRGKIRENRTPEEKESDLKSDKVSKQKCRENRSNAKKQNDLVADRERKAQEREKLLQCDIKSSIADFQNAISKGPTFICTCCHRLLYRQSVQHVKIQVYNKTSQEILDKCLSGGEWICKTCHRKLLRNTVPATAVCNKLELCEIPPELKDLSQLEARLIAQRIPFMKLMNLPSGKQKGIVGKVVNVPVDTVQTCSALPRSSSHLGFIPLKLKRKTQYSGHVMYQMVRPAMIENALKYLQENNELYHKVKMNSSWQTDFENEDEELWDALTNDCNSGIADTLSETSKNGNVDSIKDTSRTSADETTDNTLTSIQYDSCLQPGDISTSVDGNRVFSIAPGEGKLPMQILQDQNNEVLTFPNLFPMGKYGFDVHRDMKLSLRQYFQSRLLNKDNRFITNTEYLFYAQFLTEFKQVSDNINIALRKALHHDSEKVKAGILKDEELRKQLIQTDQGYQFLQTVRGSPSYCKKILYDLLAMIKQLGPFTWFLTLSAADLRWPETISIIASQFNIHLTPDDVKNLSWEERCKWIRCNPGTAARQFDHRVQQFINIIIKRGVLGNVSDYLYRTEFQQRGSPHIHMVMWVKDAPSFENSADEEIEHFIDTYVSCNLPPEDDTDLFALVNSLQRHVHSHTCRKTGKTCRFAFPRPPTEKTVVCRKTQNPHESSGNSVNPRDVLKKIFTTISEKDINGCTLTDILHLAGVQYDDYMYALKHYKSGNAVVYRRAPHDIYINNYNQDVLTAWQGNIDLQYVCDPYACVMYIASYITKPEHEMGELLTAASNQAAEAGIREQLNKVGTKFLNSREVSAQEAVYRLLSLPLKRSTRQVIYIPTELPAERVRLLKPLTVIENLDDDDEDVFMEGMVDRYPYRPHTIEDMCLAEFVSSYRMNYQKSSADNIDSTDNSIDLLEEHDDTNSIIRLQQGKGVLIRRTKPAVVRTHRYALKKYPEKYYHSMVMLYLPWRQESALLSPDRTYYTTYKDHRIAIEQNRAQFDKHAEIVDIAFEDLEQNGPPEDTWAELASESEHQRKQQMEEGSSAAEEFAFSSPDQHPHVPTYQSFRSNLALVSSESQNWIMPDSEYLQHIRTLNKEQRVIFDKIYSWCFNLITSKVTGQKPEQILWFITGSAGTGKSHLIKAIYHTITRNLRSETENPEETVCLLTAPTGTAARNIHGQTIHSAFNLMPYNSSCSQRSLQSLRVKYANLKCIIIDEISMVGAEGLVTLHNQLTDIIGLISGSTVFGGISIIAFGDLYQLPPVGQSPIYDLPKNPKFRLYGSLWQHFEISHLSEIMRQKNDVHFAQLLTRIRNQTHTDDDISTLRRRMITKDEPGYPADALHVFTTNNKVHQHNQEHLASTGHQIYTMIAKDSKADVQTGQVDISIPDNPNLTAGLHNSVQLCIHARVMITKNIDVQDGLVNGAQGTVVGFYPPPSDVDTTYTPIFVLLAMDDPSAGSAARCKYRRVVPLGSKAVPIHKEEARFKIGKYKVVEFTRCQFPLMLSWACTIHKVQGLTLDQIVVSCDGKFHPGQFYVAVSRVTSLDGLFFLNFNEHAITCNNKITAVIDSMMLQRPVVLNPPWTSPDGSTDILLSLININSLPAHFNDLCADPTLMNSDIICVTESWLTSSHSKAKFQLPEFQMFRADRSTCYTKQQLLASKAPYGGIAIYLHQHMTCPAGPPLNDVKGIEYLQFTVQKSVHHHKLTVITVYRPQWNKYDDFMDSLLKVISSLPDKTPVVILGDLNIDAIVKKNTRFSPN